MGMIAYILFQLSTLFVWVMLVWIVLGWLISFGVVSYRTPLVANIMAFSEAVTAPVLGPIRKIVPPIGGLDLSPIILLVGLNALRIYVLLPMM